MSVGGAVNGEQIVIATGTGTSSSSNAGTYAGSSLDNLTITVTGGNALASNYALPTTGTLTITPPAIPQAQDQNVVSNFGGALLTGVISNLRSSSEYFISVKIYNYLEKSLVTQEPKNNLVGASLSGNRLIDGISSEYWINNDQ